MNRQRIVLATIALAVVLFAGAVVIRGNFGERLPESSQSATTKTSKLGVPYVRNHSPILGSEDAPVTITEFFDPACEACRAFHPIVKNILTEFNGKVRVVLRYAAFHKESREAVQVLEAARRQNKFEPILETLLKWQPVWAPHGREGASFWRYLSDAGLNVSQAREAMGNPEILAVLNIDAEDIRTLNVRQTPTFFVNGKLLREFGPKQLYNLVKSEVDALH